MSKHVIDVNSINPVDHYNRMYVEHTIQLLEKIKCVERNSPKSLTYVKNASDRKKQMVRIDTKTGLFEAEMPNGFGMEVGEEYTAFMMLQKFVHKGNWRRAVNYVIYQLMNNEDSYIRVGDDYFKKLHMTDRYGVERLTLKHRKRQTLMDDYGKDFLGHVHKFDAFDIVPNNKYYLEEVNGCYNQYRRFEHKPIVKEKYTSEENFEWTKNLLKHIFGDHYYMGLVYLKTLYDAPTRALPILVLISEERQTGKTTFVNWLSILFGANGIVCNPQDIGSSFNGVYAEKNLIMIEESHFDSRQTLEKIKNLSTQQKITVNSKFVSQYEVPFFGKIIITSNDENKFSKVDGEEIRYWVRKVPTLVGKENHNILEDLQKEIPYFLYFLDNLREFEPKTERWIEEDNSITKKFSRMVFAPGEISTEALTKVKKESRETLHKDIEIYLDGHCMQNPSIEEFHFVSTDIKEKWFAHNQRYSASYINRVLKNSMKLPKVPLTNNSPTRYHPLEEENNMLSGSKVGRPYAYANKFYNTNINDETDEKPDVPF